MAEATDVSNDADGPVGRSWSEFFAGSIGSKVLMAGTGLVLWMFLVGHLAGNTLIYFGPEAFNHYAATLHSAPVLLWAVRIVMLVSFPVHVVTAIQTARASRAARPVAYAFGNKSPARLASTSMALSGLIVLVFLGYHLAQFTWRATGLPAGADSLSTYSMVVDGFRQPLIAGFYVLGVALLALHLSHGLYSMFQHVGLAGRRWTPWLKTASLVVGYGMCAAFAAIPLYVNVILGGAR